MNRIYWIRLTNVHRNKNDYRGLFKSHKGLQASKNKIHWTDNNLGDRPVRENSIQLCTLSISALLQLCSVRLYNKVENSRWKSLAD